MKSLLQLVVPEAQESCKSSNMAAERESRERLPTLKAHPATGFLQQGFTLPPTVLPARKQVFHT